MITARADNTALLLLHETQFSKDYQMGIKIYEVTPKYVDYIVPLAPHLFQNKQPGQHNERKYVGIVLNINGFNYFAPLSSYKAKHKRMQENLDFIKLGDMAVININNMFPVPDGHFSYVDISTIKDAQYKQACINYKNNT